MRHPALGAAIGLALLAGLACADRDADDAAAPASEAPAPERVSPLEAERSPSAREDTHAMLLEDLASTRHPSDGGGRAWIERAEPVDGTARIRARGRARIALVYEAGPLGIAEGGSLFVQTSPFWGWDTPQPDLEDAPGYTTVRTAAAGVELVPETVDYQLMRVGIEGAALPAGERIEIELGAGPAGLRVDRYAERGARVWLAVDGDGDGVRSLLPDSPSLDVAPGPPAKLLVTLPTVARPGAPVRLTLAWLDAAGNAVAGSGGDITLGGDAAALGLPERVAPGLDAGGFASLEGRVDAEGVYRVRARATWPAGDGETATLEVESNPLLVSGSAPRVLWADLHGHTALSDGTGTPDDYFAYARDRAALDVVALTDHDHWGMRFLDAEPELWREIAASAKRHHEPGRFVTVFGYEWTSWLYGHRHVLHFGAPDAERFAIRSSVAAEHDEPAELWASLAGQPVLTFAHHSAGGPVATAWSHRPPPELEPVTEIVSVHGSSEALDSPGVIYSPVPGNFVRDVLDTGMRFGFIGSGDGHDGHPGLTRLEAAQGGLAAIFAEEHTREAVRAALLARRCYATNGARIWLRFALDGRPMGSVVAGDGGRPHALEIAVLGTAPIERVELVRSGAVLAPIEGGGETSFSALVELPALGPGEYVYARVLQSDGGAAWTTPIYAE